MGLVCGVAGERGELNAAVNCSEEAWLAGGVTALAISHEMTKAPLLGICQDLSTDSQVFRHLT